jgi:hypothetical protein
MTNEETIKREDVIFTVLVCSRISNLSDEEKWDKCVNLINKLPSTDRPKGEWMKDECKDGEQWYRCSNCGERYVLIETSGRSLDVGFPFCPHCAADMRGDEE